MPDVLLMILIAGTGMGLLISIIGFSCEGWDGIKPKATFLALLCLLANMIVWLSVAYNSERPYTEHRYPINWVELESGVRVQVATTEEKSYNITNLTGKVYPDNTYFIVRRYITQWSKGVKLLEKPEEIYIIDNQQVEEKMQE